jgi:hypothetical protein
MSMDGGPYPATPGSYPQSAGASGRATTSMVLGILSFLCCHLLGPVAWYLAVEERKAIRAGLSSPAGDGIATAGMILGIIGTAFLALGILLGILWIFVFGGLAVVGALAGSH